MLAGTILAVAVLSGLTWRNGAVPQVANLNDTVAFLDGVWRIYHGQRAHVDFHNLVGVIPFALGAAAMRLTGPTAVAIAVELAALQVVTATLMWGVARTRVPALIAGALAVWTALLVGSPHVLGTPSNQVTFGMFYNRLGWAVALAAWLAVLVPRRDGREAGWERGLVGALVGCLFLIKVNYFVVTVLVVLLGWGVRDRRWRGMAGLGLTAALTAWLILAVTGAGLQGYWSDLGQARRSQEWWKLGAYVGPTWRDNLPALALFAALLAAAWRRGVSWRRWWPAAAAGGAGLMVMQANSHAGLAPAWALAGLALVEVLRRAGSARRTVVMYTVAAAAFAVPIAVPDVLAVARATWASGAAARIGRGPVYLSGVLSDLPLRLQPQEPGEEAAWRTALLARAPGGYGMTPAQWAASCRDGLALLRARAGKGPRVVTMDLFNPWPLLLGGDPPRGDWIAWDPGRNVSRSSHLAFAEFTRDATHVMVPRAPYYQPATELKLEIYGRDLAREFRMCGGSELWTLWERRPPGTVTSR